MWSRSCCALAPKNWSTCRQSTVMCKRVQGPRTAVHRRQHDGGGARSPGPPCAPFCTRRLWACRSGPGSPRACSPPGGQTGRQCERDVASSDGTQMGAHRARRGVHGIALPSSGAVAAVRDAGSPPAGAHLRQRILEPRELLGQGEEVGEELVAVVAPGGAKVDHELRDTEERGPGKGGRCVAGDVLTSRLPVGLLSRGAGALEP